MGIKQLLLKPKPTINMVKHRSVWYRYFTEHCNKIQYLQTSKYTYQYLASQIPNTIETQLIP